MVGFIEPVGTTFQSMTLLRKANRTAATMRNGRTQPRQRRSQRGGLEGGAVGLGAGSSTDIPRDEGTGQLPQVFRLRGSDIGAPSPLILPSLTDGGGEGGQGLVGPGL